MGRFASRFSRFRRGARVKKKNDIARAHGGFRGCARQYNGVEKYMCSDGGVGIIVTGDSELLRRSLV